LVSIMERASTPEARFCEVSNPEPAHPGHEDLRRFMHGDLSRPEVRGVVRHLLRGCRGCISVTQRLWQIGEGLPGSVARFVEPASRGHDEPGLISGRYTR